MLEREVHLRGKIKSAMTYPVAVVGLVVLIMSAMLLFVVPQFEGIYAQLGGTLPLPTRALLAISDIVKSYWCIVIGVVFVGAVPLPPVQEAPRRAARRRPLKLRIPVFGSLFHKTALSRFSSTFAMLLSAGRADPAGAGHRVRHREQQGDRLQGRRRRADERPRR